MLGCLSRKIVFYFAFLIACLLFIVFVLLPQKKIYDANHIDIPGIYLIKPLPVPSFTLTDNHGKSLTQNNLKGHWSFLFFGFTRCNSVCPVTMHALKEIYESLAATLPAEQRPQIIFISVDPEHDSIKTLNTYVTAFHPTFKGARTNPEETTRLEKAFHITALKSDNNINHSSDVLLINPKAEIQAYFSYPLKAKPVIQAYNTIIKRSN